MKKLVIIGTGQLSQDVKFFVERYKLYEIVGYAINEKYIKEEEYAGCPIYPLERLDEYVDKNDTYFFVAISWFHYLNKSRQEAFDMLKAKGFKAANLISPNATVLTENIGEGNWINDFVYLDFETNIGSNNVMRNYAYIGHYVTIKDHCFIGAKSLIGRNSSVGSRCFIGISSTVFNDVTIGDKCIVGGAAVAKTDLLDFSVCKVSSESMVIKQYTSEVIEQKLIPHDKLMEKRDKHETE